MKILTFEIFEPKHGYMCVILNGVGECLLEDKKPLDFKNGAIASITMFDDTSEPMLVFHGKDDFMYMEWL